MIRKRLYFLSACYQNLCAVLSSPFKRRGLSAAHTLFAAVTFSLLFLLTGCMIRVQPIADTPTPVTPTTTETSIPTAVPTSTIVWFPATATPRPLNTPTPFPTVNALPRLGDVILSDDFSDDRNWQTYRSPAGNAVISNNELTLALQNSKNTIASYSSLPQLGDYYLSMNVSLSLCTNASDWYGIAFRIQDSDNTYRWLFNCLGQTRVERVYHGRVYLISDWDINGAIKPAAPQKFSIGIAAEGPSLRFYANNTLLKEEEDTIFPTGGYGLLASSEGLSPLTVSFSDFKLTEILQ